MNQACRTMLTLLCSLLFVCASVRGQAVEVVDIGHLGGGSSTLTGISPSGEWACGWSVAPSGLTHAVLFRVPTRQLIDLGPFNGANTSAIGVNDSGMVVASVTDTQNRGRVARISSPGAYQLLPLPASPPGAPAFAAPSSEGRAINREGDVIGRWTNWRNVGGTWTYAWDACVWLGTTHTQLSGGWPGTSFGTAISNRVPVGDLSAMPWVVFERDYAGYTTTLAKPNAAGVSFWFPDVGGYAYISDLNEAGDCIGETGLASYYRYQNGTVVNLQGGGRKKLAENGDILLGAKIVRATDVQGINLFTQTTSYASVTAASFGGYYVFDLRDISENRWVAGSARQMVSGTPTRGVLVRFERCGTDGVSGPPMIVQQPVAPSTPICTTGPLSLSVSAVASGTIRTYQWRRNGVGINTLTNPSAATADLIVAGAPTPHVDNTQYDCVVSTVCGSVTSQAVTVRAGVVVTSQPSPFSYFCDGATLRVIAAGSGPLTYQWRRNGVPIPAAGNPSAATSALSISSPSDAGASYDCVISDGCATLTTAPTQLLNQIRITTHPVPSVNLLSSTQSTLSITAEGPAALSYRWLRNGTPIDIQANPSAATATLTLPPGGLCGSNRVGWYQCVVSSACHTATSGASSVFVDDPVVTRSLYVNPRQQYFVPGPVSSDPGARVSSVSRVFPIDLQSLGLFPGRAIRLVREGSVLITGTPGSEASAMIGVFGSATTTNSSGTQISGLIAAGTPVVTSYSAANLDIPQDFAITDTVVTIPPGARYLSVMANAPFVGAALDTPGQFRLRLEDATATGVSPFVPAGDLPSFANGNGPGSITSMAVRADGKVVVASWPSEEPTPDFESYVYSGPILSIYDADTLTFTTILDGSEISNPAGGLSIGPTFVLNDGDYLLSMRGYAGDQMIGSTLVRGIARYDVSTQTWSSLPPLMNYPSKVIQSTTGDIFAACWNNEADPQNPQFRLVRYNPATGVAQQIGQSQINTDPSSMIALRNGDILVLPYPSPVHNFRNQVLRYNPVSNQWADLTASEAPPPSSVVNFGVAAELANGDLLVTGDFNVSNLTGIARYRTDVNSWVALSPGGVEWSAGGSFSFSRLANNEVVATIDGIYPGTNSFGSVNVRFDLTSNRFELIGPWLVGMISDAVTLPNGDALLAGTLSTSRAEYPERYESLMRWNLSGEASLRIARQPSDQSLCTPGTKSFSVVVQGTGTITYQWQHDGVNIDVPTNPSAATATLILDSPIPGSYRCVVSNPCSVVMSDSASLTSASCGCSPADIANTDGDPTPDNALDNGDFTAFFAAFFAPTGDPAQLLADIANTDGETTVEGAGPDGVIDNGDFTAFFAFFFVGCN